MTFVKEYKFKIMKQISNLNSLSKVWDIWQPKINSALGEQPTGKDIFGLGEKLSSIFQTYETDDRDQSTLSGGGAAWECLNVWFLNLLFWDTSIIVSRTNKALVPECLRNALTVSFSSIPTNTESDVSIFKIPESGILKSSKIEDINAHLENKISEIDFVNLQCKTNWNDNAQIPMLWDLIYNVQKFKISYISVGIKGISPNSFSSFSYAFSTVPTVKKAKFKKDSLAVLRVKNLSGGNYWGHPTDQGIAKCINELAGNHFANEFRGGLINHINESLKKDSSYLDRFIKLDF